MGGFLSQRRCFPASGKQRQQSQYLGYLGPFAELFVCVTLLGALRHTDRSLMLAENFPLI